MDASVPAHRAAPGTLRAAVNLVPAGPPDSFAYEVAAGAEAKSEARRLLALGRQVRQVRGALSDLEGDPEQSLERLVGCTEGALVIIDPSQNWATREIHAFDEADATRTMQLAPVARGHWAALSKGPEHKEPEQVVEVRDDAVLPLKPPALPTVEITAEETADPGDDEKLLDAGEYVFRFAWMLKDGTIGPPGGPQRVELSSAETGAGFELTFRIAAYPYPLPAAFAEQITGIAVFVQPPLLRDSNDDPREGAERGAMKNPAYRVAPISGTSVGDEVEWADASELILTYDALRDESLLQHEIRAGAAFGYNQALMLGDVAYDFHRPRLRKMLGTGGEPYRDGIDNAGGNDYWVRLGVEIATSNGRFERFSEALPFDEAAAASATFAGGLLYYADLRAERWAMYVSQDHVPGSTPGTWSEAVMQGARRDFTAGGGNYGYASLEASYDLRTAGASSENVYDDLEGETSASSSAYYETQGTADLRDDSHHVSGPEEVNPYLDFGTELAADAVIDLKALVSAWASGYQARAVAELRVRVLDVEGDLVDSASRTASVNVNGRSQTDGGDYALTLDAGGAVSIEFDLITRDTLASSNGQPGADSYASANSRISRPDGVRIRVSAGGGTIGAERTGAEIAAAGGKVDHDPNRMLVSRTGRPRDLPASQAGYIGDGPADGIVGFASSTLPASEGQFGEFPVYALCRESVSLGQVGPTGGPNGPIAFAGWRKVSTRGCVGRQAFCNLDRAVVFASPDGIYQLAPDLSREPLSAPLHKGDFLASLGAHTALGYYHDGGSAAGRARRELWASAGRLVFSFSLRHGGWTILDRERWAFGQHAGRLLGTGPLAGGAGGKLFEEGASSAAQKVFVQTSRLYFGALGAWKRLRRLWLRQDDPLSSLTWKLFAQDPTVGRLLLSEAAMTSAPYDVFPLAAGMCLEAEVELIGEGLPGQSMEGVGFELDVRMPHRRPATMRTDEALPWTAAGGVTADTYLGEINRAPAFDTGPVTSAESGSAYTYGVQASDPDDGDVVAFSLRTAPPWLSLTDHGDSTATLSGTAPGTASETYDVTVVASDGVAETEQTFQITVTGAVALDFTDPDNSGYLTLLTH